MRNACAQYSHFTLKVTVNPYLLFPEERFTCYAFLRVLFPSADEGTQEKEKTLEKPESNSSPGKGEDKEVKPGKVPGGFGERSGARCPAGQGQ